MIYTYQAVELIPKQLTDGIVYHSEKFELAALLCACGCGHRVTLLVPDSHKVTSDGGFATIRPSIAVCDAACKSHYYITGGRVRLLPALTGAQTTSLMRGQIARHAALDVKLSWFGRLRHALLQMVRAAKSIFPTRPRSK